MTNQASTSMVFFASFRTSIEKIDLPAETKLNYYEAVLDYGLFGITPHFDNPILEALFDVLEPIIDANTRKKQHSITCSEMVRKEGLQRGMQMPANQRRRLPKQPKKQAKKQALM